MCEKILLNSKGDITYLTLNNPQKRNAFDKEMSDFIIKEIKNAESKNQRGIVINAVISNGIFSAGHDLNELESASDLSQDPMFEMFDSILNTNIPVIAEVDGFVFAGALHLLMVCDLVYATKTSKIIMTANKMGVPFSLQNYQNWLSVMGLHKIKELFYTATPLNAEDAYNSGIFNAFLDSTDELKEKVESVCQAIISCCPVGISNSKFQLNLLANNVIVDYDSAVKIETMRNDILNSNDFIKRVDALIDKINHKKTSSGK